MTSMTSMTAPRASRRAFTILEMITTIGLILLITSLVVASLHGVRQSAYRTDAMAALRQMMVGYNAYMSDSNQQLLPGYISAERFDETQPANVAIFRRAKIGAFPAPGKPFDFTDAALRIDAGSYVWRLAPYLDYTWQAFFRDYQSEQLLLALASELGGDDPEDLADNVYGAGTAASDASKLGISRTPSFGLNSIFLGGDDVHGGNTITERNPWTPDDPSAILAATRFSEVRNPARVVVFGSAKHWSQDDFSQALFSDLEFGAPTLRPPMLGWNPQDPTGAMGENDSSAVEEPQWELGSNSTIIYDNGAEYGAGDGVPVARWGKDLVPISHLDGSTGTETLHNLSVDFRKWSPFATGY